MIKSVGIFILLEVLIAFVIGLFGLLGMNLSLSKILLLLINMIIFFVYGVSKGKITNKKGFVEGLLTGGILIAILFIVSLIFFHQSLGMATIFYYLALLFIAVIGATIGKNKKIDSTLSERK